MQSRIISFAIVAAFALPLSSCDKFTKKSDDATTSIEDASGSKNDEFTVTPRLIRNDGSYQLVAVVEGVEPNRQFLANLQLVTGQRAILKKLKEEKEQTAEIKQKIEALEKKLKENSEGMVKNYGYNINSDYLFIPVYSALVKVVDEKKTLVRRINSPKAYHELQAARAKYSELLAKDGEASAEVKALADKLMKDFDCDVKVDHTIDVSKSVLYLKVQ